MVRRSDRSDDDILSLIGRTKTNLSIDDVADAVAGALKEQKRDIIAHMQRKFELERLRDKSEDVRTRNFHARITALESELRQIKKERRWVAPVVRQQPAFDFLAHMPVGDTFLTARHLISMIEAAAAGMNKVDQTQLGRLMTAAGHEIGLTARRP